MYIFYRIYRRTEQKKSYIKLHSRNKNNYLIFPFLVWTVEEGKGNVYDFFLSKYFFKLNILLAKLFIACLITLVSPIKQCHSIACINFTRILVAHAVIVRTKNSWLEYDFGTRIIQYNNTSSITQETVIKVFNNAHIYRELSLRPRLPPSSKRIASC